MGKSNKFSLATKSNSSTRVNPYDKITLNALNVSCPDKHIVLPKLDSNGTQLLSIELYSLFIFIVALGTQYLNLYRSVWWLSKTKGHPPINFHLIDSDVSKFSLTFIGQSSLITLLRTLSNKAVLPTRAAQGHLAIQNHSNTNGHQHISQSSEKHQSQYRTSAHQHSPSAQTSQIKNTTLTTIVTATASWICNYYLLKYAYRIWNSSGLNGLSSISYPIIISIILNSTQIVQIYEDCRKTGKLNLSFLTLSVTLFSFHINFDDDKLCHTCSNQPDEIRDEVERFRTIFSERLRLILLKSTILAYYSSFVPICFAQSFLYYDHAWTFQNVVITWLSSLIMLISSSYTPHFYDVLHRSAYHFGKWSKLEARNTLVPCINWSENVIYPQGVVVKHYRGYFRSESVSNCAQPGVSSHLRYYVVFANPRVGYASVLILLSLLLVVQMYLLLISTEWYRLVAVTCMMLINVHSIFRLVKSLVVITNIYKVKRI